VAANCWVELTDTLGVSGEREIDVSVGGGGLPPPPPPPHAVMNVVRPSNSATVSDLDPNSERGEKRAKLEIMRHIPGDRECMVRFGRI
jgi:hypothetical protein